MNRFSSSPDGDSDQLLKAAAFAKAEQDKFGLRAKAAAERLAAAVVFQQSTQATLVGAALASIYNGSSAMTVRLDEPRWLEWDLQRDLVIVMIGTGHAGFEDRDIRDAFYKAGGQPGVEWLHWHTSGGPYRSALKRLLEFIVANHGKSDAKVLLLLFRSITRGGKADLTALDFVERDLAEGFISVMNGLWGSDRGSLRVECIAEAFEIAGGRGLLAAGQP